MKKSKKIKNYFRRNLGGIIVLIFALVFVSGVSAFNIVGQNFSRDLSIRPDFIKWGSPDESANYIFSKLYAQEGQLWLQEDYNLLVDDIMHPRSFRSDNGVIKPVSFLGIILVYGKIASLTSYKLIPFFTPFLAGIGIIFFYLFIKRLFGRNNALISALLLSIFPPFVYYSARSMFHNVPFVVFLIIGLFYSLLMAKERKELRVSNIGKPEVWLPLGFASLAGFFIGLAIIFRSSELLWLLPLILGLGIINLRQIGLTRLILFLSFLFLALCPVFYYNQILYGSFFSGGYPQMNESINTLAHSSSELISASFVGGSALVRDKLATIKDTIFHFGFDREESVLVFKNYFVRMFAYIFWPALFGLILFLQRWRTKKKKHWLYLIFYFFISLILVFYYGSWEFHDNPDLASITIGNSYTRYWLPVYLGALPLASLFILRFSRVFCHSFRSYEKLEQKDKKREAGQQKLFREKPQIMKCLVFLRIVIVLALSFVSIRFTLFGSDEGLINTALRQRQAGKEWEEIIQLTESNSAIVTRYHDKLFFPERKVIVGLFDDKNMNERYARLAKEIPIYYYNFKLPNDALDYLNTRRLFESGLSIKLIKDINDTFSLYSLDSL